MRRLNPRFVSAALVLAVVLVLTGAAVATPAPLCGDPPPSSPSANPPATAAAPAAPADPQGAAAGPQASQPPAQAPAASTQAAQPDDEDLTPSPTQPDFTLLSLPTTLPLPRHKAAFRVTHRFTRPLNQGSFGSSASDFFGLDSGAQIGLEFRFAPVRNAQVGVYRTSDKTIDFFGAYDVLRVQERLPISLALVGAVEGTNNFKDEYSPSIGAVVSVDIGKIAAVYVEPTFVGNTNPLARELVDHDDTLFIGLGARLRMAPGAYLVAEVSPRVYGYKGGTSSLQGTPQYQAGKPLVSFGIEKQVGGHVFQLNVSNTFATTPANIARGAANGRTDWYLGFNISRKFY